MGGAAQRTDTELIDLIHGRSNNSFNRSANSVAFMRETLLFIMARRARLIRALAVFFIMMRIRFEATVDEFIEVQERAVRRSKVARSWQRQGAIISALLSGIISAIPIFIFAFAVQSLLLPALLFAGFAFIFGVGVSLHTRNDKIRHRLRNYFRERFGDRDRIPFELELRETGILTNQLGVQSNYEWSNVEEIKQTEGAIEFYMYGGGVVFVRKRAFTSFEEHHKFIDVARQYLNASRNSSNWLRDS